MNTSVKSILQEIKLSRVLQHTKDRNIAFLTAHRQYHDDGRKVTPEENNRRNRELEREIKKAGYGYAKVTGGYIENRGDPEKETHVKEKSFMIIGKKGNDNGELLKFAKRMGEKYQQDSILHKAADSEEAHLHGTGKSTWIKKGEKMAVGKWHTHLHDPDYYTKVKNGMFQFRTDESASQPMVVYESIEFGWLYLPEDEV